MQNFKILETHIVPAISGEIRLQEYAPQVLKTISSRSGIKKAIKREEILVDGRVGKTSDWIKPNQKIEVLQQEKQEKKLFQLKLEIVFEDQHLAVVNKPAGYPTSGNFFKTIENALPFNLLASEEVDSLPYPLPVHRLDNPTSGLLIVAKTRTAQTILSRNFENKEIQKIYLALVLGKTPETAVYTDDLNGKKAVTSIKLLKNYFCNKRPLSFLEVLPETGRTHQIRKHLSLHNFPIVGDEIYNDVELPFKKGLFLSAIALRFTHPVTGEPLHLYLPHPKKFQLFQNLT